MPSSRTRTPRSADIDEAIVRRVVGALVAVAAHSDSPTTAPEHETEASSVDAEPIGPDAAPASSMPESTARALEALEALPEVLPGEPAPTPGRSVHELIDEILSSAPDLDPKTAKVMIRATERANEKALVRDRASRFTAAMARFQRVAPALSRDVDGELPGEEDDAVEHSWSSHGHICRTFNPLLGALGIRPTFGAEPAGAELKITVSLHHEGVVADSLTLTVPPDTRDGRTIYQGIASAITHISRYLYLCLLGQASSRDQVQQAGLAGLGAAANEAVEAAPAPVRPPELIDDEEARALSARLDRLDELAPGSRKRQLATLRRKGRASDNALGIGLAPARAAHFSDRLDELIVEAEAERRSSLETLEARGDTP